MLEKLLYGSQTFSRWLTWIASSLIVLSALQVTVEVVLRKTLNVSLGGADEISGYAFGVATTLSLSFALFERAHIRVDALIGHVPQSLRPFINMFGVLLLIGSAMVVVSMVWTLVGDTLQHSSRSITPMRVPLAIPQIPWLLGWIFFVFSGLLIAAVSIQRYLRGDSAGVQNLIGVKSLDEQIEDETV